MKISKAKIYTAMILGNAFWGFSFMASRVALDRVHMFVLLSHRFILAFAVLTLLIVTGAVRCDLKSKSILPLLVLGLGEPVVYFLGEQYGILHTNTIFSGVMIAMIPVACTLAAAPVLKEVPTASQFFFSLLSVAGVIGTGLMTNSSGSIEAAGVAGLAAAVIGAVVYTLQGRRIREDYTPFERTYVMMAMGAAVFTALAAVTVRGEPGAYFRPLSDMHYLIPLLFLGLCCSVGSFFMVSFAITYLPVAKVTVFTNLTTMVSVFAGAVFLKEPFTPVGLVCCVMILVGIWGVQKT